MAQIFMCIIYDISKTENDIWTLQFFDFFTWWVPLQVIPFKHIRFTSCFHLVLLTCSKTKVSQLTFLFCYFISVLLRSNAAFQLHAFCNSFMNTGYKFSIFYIVLIFYIVSWVARHLHSWRLIMKYFLRSFSPFRWFKKGSCQFLAKECAQYWLTA